MGYSKEEQESVLVFNYSTGLWDAYSTVPKHIRKLSSICDDIQVLEYEDDRPIAVRCQLTEKQVGMKKERKLSEEHKEKLRENAKKMHEGK